MIVLVLNSGSSSLKYQIRDTAAGAERPEIASGVVERIGQEGSGYEHKDHLKGTKNAVELPLPDHAAALEAIGAEIDASLGELRIGAVGHRVVHGGEKFSEPVVVTDEVLSAIEELSSLAPLHNPANALGIRAIAAKWPDLPQVAVFDTGFHGTMPEVAWRYPLPAELYEQHGIRRYGFHGTSHQFVSGQAAEFLGLPAEEFDGVVAHVGNGASVTAVRAGRSVDTSMGFTPLAGLMMGTRSGDVDPSILVYLMRQGYDADRIDTLLNKESGYQGVAGNSDLRTVEDDALAGDGRAKLALDIACYGLAKYIGAYHVACGGMKALVFTAGVGENSDVVRRMTADLLAPLGVKLDEESNSKRSKEVRVISSPDSSVPVLVVPTNEEQAIAEFTAALVG